VVTLTSKRIKLAFSFGFAILVAAIMLSVLIHLRDVMSWALAALGLAIGWPTGILASPYQSERERFASIGKVVAGFISGYAVSKIDRVFELWMDPARGPLMLEPTFAQRAVLFMTAFLIATVVTYVGRKYVSFGPDAEHPQSSSSS
jgi:fructose-specific phosphotransferase system IIC component